jgi:uncharacterized protein YydD (DUF2326 family)
VFNEGLNVIVGRVTKPKESDKDSHNLGKSLLAQVIDFTLLKDIDKNHFFKKQAKSFQGMVMFLEVKLNTGRYLTIRRDTQKTTKVQLWISDEGDRDLSQVGAEEWPQKPASLRDAIRSVNEAFGFNTLGPYDYRKGISYFLRSQDDYRNVFQLSKFSSGKHQYWKPFMGMLLGFSEENLRKKYELDESLQKEKEYASRSAYESGTREDAYDKIRGLLTIKRSEIEKLQKDSDAFEIHNEDTQVNDELVNTLERRNAELNDRIYTIDYELSQIRDALDKRLTFDIEKVKIIFAQAVKVLPDTYLRSFEELVAFNKEITEDRNVRLQKRAGELTQERSGIAKELAGIDDRRRSLLSVLRTENWFLRFRDLQTEIARSSAEISRLEAQLETVNKLEEIRKTIEHYEEAKAHLTSTIREEVRHGNSTFEAIRKRFNEIFRAIFNVPALLSTTQNGDGNLDFEATPVEDLSLTKATSEGEGHSYRKVLCASFDVALLEAYRERSFYRFVYHDGIFESLDDRKKINLLAVVRASCRDKGIQYLMSVIDADIPWSPAGKRIDFEAGEIVMELHDGGDAGRLFKMPKF